jgi:predicted phage tail protein
MSQKIIPFEGVEGAKKKSGSGVSATSTPINTPTTYRSNTNVTLVEAISEGEIVGLVNGVNSIRLGNTAIVNPDGSVNFHGLSWDFRHGTPDQGYFPSNPTAQTPYVLQTPFYANQPPIIHTIADENATSVKVIITIPELQSQDFQGDIFPWQANWSIDVRPAGGSWQSGANVAIYQKFGSPASFQNEIQLPEGGFPWDIRVTKTSADGDGVYFIGQTIWDSYVEVVSAKLAYPNTAVCLLQFDAAYFGSSTIPTRTYHVKGRIIDVPANYDADARTYTGIWDGTFKRSYTNNPAWVLRDILINDRYGLGEFLTTDMIDKWALYQIAQYCDELVSDGYGGSEPRYTINTQIRNKVEAFKLIQSIAATFRGMAFWSMSTVLATADMPSDPVKIYSKANVIDGVFNYSGTSIKARHSVAMVTWADPQDFYNPAIEVVIDADMLQRHGWRELTLDAVGCTSRSMAHRYGKWALDTEKNAFETVEFTASWDSAEVNPGDIVAIADASKAQVRAGGRISAVDTLIITLDGAFEPGVGQTYNLMVVTPDGAVVSQSVSSIVGNVVTLSAPFSTAPQVGAMWAITGTDIAPRQFRVMSKEEKEANLFHITALLHDPTKYERIENNISFNPVAYYRPPTTIVPPTNLTFNETLYQQNGSAMNRLLISWTPGNDFLAIAYNITAQSPNGFIDYGQVVTSNFTIENPPVGDWVFNIAAVSIAGTQSIPLTGKTTVKGWAGVAGPSVTNLEIFGQGSTPTFSGKDCTVVWTNDFPGSSYDYGSNPDQGIETSASNPFYRDNLVSIYDPDTNTLLRTEVVTTESYVYTFEKNTADYASFGLPAQRRFRIEVSVRDTLGRQSEPTKIVCNNPVPDLLIPNVSASLSTIYVDYPRPSDPDFTGSIIWVSTDQNFDPLSTSPSYDGPLTAVSFAADQFTDYYVRLAPYDAFNKLNLNISPAVKISVGGISIDTRPPPVPTGLSLSSATTTLADGTVNVALTASWDETPAMDPIPGSPPGFVNNFAYFDVAISLDGTNFVTYQTALPTYNWQTLLANTNYYVKARAVSQNGYASNYCTVASGLSATKTTPPGAPTGFAITSSLKSAYLTWANPSDTDIAGVEIWQSLDSTLAHASSVGAASGHAFTISGLTTGTTYYYWLRAYNTSGVRGAYVGPVSVTPGQVANGDISANAITADKIVAGSITGDRFSTSTSLPATITIGSSGVEIGATLDPASLVNGGSTTIDPGKILISGSTTLSSWRDGTDTTKIAGGSIQANTIQANSLTIGSRGVTISGIQFSYDSSNNISWSAGTVNYVADNGSNTTVSVAAGGPFLWSFGTYYIAWHKGSTTLSISSAPFTGADYITFATYRGGVDLVANYGRTIIDGSQIVTGSIQANNIAAGAITAGKIAAGAVQASNIAAGAITADKIAAGTITATGSIYVGGTSFALSASNQNLSIIDTQSTPETRVVIGKIGSAATDYGIEVYNAAGTMIFSSGSGVASSDGISANVINSTHIQSGSITSTEIAANTITAANVLIGGLTAAQLAVDTISTHDFSSNTSGDSSVTVSLGGLNDVKVMVFGIFDGIGNIGQNSGTIYLYYKGNLDASETLLGSAPIYGDSTKTPVVVGAIVSGSQVYTQWGFNGSYSMFPRTYVTSHYIGITSNTSYTYRCAVRDSGGTVHGSTVIAQVLRR